MPRTLIPRVKRNITLGAVVLYCQCDTLTREKNIWLRMETRQTPATVRFRFSLVFAFLALHSLFLTPLSAQTETPEEVAQPIPTQAIPRVGAETQAETEKPKTEKQEIPSPPEQQSGDDVGLDDEVPPTPDAASDVDAEQGDPLDPPRVETPLEVLGRLFFGGNDVPNQKKNSKNLLRKDPRAPFNTKLSGLLNKAQIHFRANETQQCAVVLQKLLEQPEDALWEVAPGKLVSVRTAAQRLLAKLPKEEQERYRLMTGGQALRELQLSQATGSATDLAQVATKFFQTEAGFQAADQLASRYFDRGEFGLAAHWMEELWQAQAPCTKRPGWRLKAEFVARMVPTTGLAKLLKSQSATLPTQATIAGQVVDARKWLVELAGEPEVTTPTLNDWPQFFGSASRVGQAAAGEPLLLKRWAIPLTTNPAVQSMMDKLIDDLRDMQQTPILTFDPLLVDDKVVFRSLHGVLVADARTGKLLWTTADEPSADDLLSAAASQQANPDEQQGVAAGNPTPFPLLTALVEVFDELEGSAPSDHPLTHLLFRNANHGLLSSDGRRLFVIEDQSVLSNLQPGRYQGEDVPDVDLFGRPLGVNRLTAYDLRSGRSVWEAGGRDLNDPFTLPLAGTFIFGPPVIEGGELLLVNELDGEIRLQVLDPATGIPRWSQLIAYAQTKINVDFGRQWFTSQVAVANGVIVCPTTVGWLVAVDRTTRNILWAHRYEDFPNEEFLEPQDEAVQSTQLNERWIAAPPVIVGNRVIIAPPEAQVIACLNLSDGALQWKRTRGDEELFLAGVFGKQALIVANNRITSLDIEHKGKTLWTVKYDSNDARPAGRGVAVQNRYYLPLTTGELLSIDLADGTQTERIVTRLKLPPSPHPALQQFGNLAMYHGMLLSLGSQGIVAFEPKLSIEAELQQELTANPLSAAAVIRKAELELLHERPGSAWDLLQGLPANSVSEDLQPRFRATSVSALSALVRSDLTARDAEFVELCRWAENPTERQACEMLQAERYIARKNLLAAFDVYLSFAQTYRTTLLVPATVSGLQVRGDHWAAGKLQQLWAGLDSETSRTLDDRVMALAQSAVVDQIPAQYQFLTLFGFHPSSQMVRRRLVDALVQSEAWQAAENVLWELQRDPGQRAWATERSGRLWRQIGDASDAAQAYQTLEQQYPTSPLDGGTPGLDVVRTLREAGQLPLTESKPQVNWRNRNLELTRSASNFDLGGSTHVFPLQGAGLPYFKRHRIQYVPQDARFEVIDVTTENRVWSIPLRIPVETAPESVSVRIQGHSVVLFGGGQVTSLSPMERRVIWSRPQRGRPVHDEENILTDTDSDGGGQRFAEPLRSVANRSGRHSDFARQWAIFPQNGAPQVIANQRYVCYLTRRQLVALDAATGDVIWERHDLPSSARIRGGSQAIYVLNFQDESVVAYSSLDGSKLDLPNLKKQCSFAVDLVDDDLILMEHVNREQAHVESKDPLREGSSEEPRVNTVSLTRFNPLTRENVWRISLPGTVKAATISGHRLAILNADGRLQLCDLATGTLTSSGSLALKSIRKDTEIRVIPTFDQILVVANQTYRFPEDNFPESFASIRVQGMVQSFDLATGREQWKQNVEGLHLIVERLDHSPIALFLSRRFQRNQSNNWQLHLLAIDRFAGQIVHDSTTSVQSSFQLLNVNVPEEYVELRTYNDRLRLAPKPD